MLSFARLTEGVGKVIADRCIRGCALAALVAVLATGCSETLPLAQLPDATKVPQRVLSKDEQQGKVTGMIEKGQRHQTEAAKEIEKGR